MEYALQVKDLSKTFILQKRMNHVLKNISFSIEKGEMVAIMGPSGSGKSTLLYSVSGMDRPTAGDVYLENTKITDLNEKELAQIRLQSMGFIFQQMHMLKNLSIRDNILLPAYEASKNKEMRVQKDQYCQELMKKLDITEIGDNDVTQVSGGQLQRACICRSLMNQPAILFADEPTGALNKSASEEVMKELNKLNHQGITIMLVTHDMKVASKCSRILYIVDGNINGELEFDQFEDTRQTQGEFVEGEVLKLREKRLSQWLNDMGW